MKTHCLSAVVILENWCKNKREQSYNCTCWNAKVILPDAVPAKIASNGKLQTMDDLNTAIEPPWVFAGEHGDKVLALLAQLDIRERNFHQRVLQQNRESKWPRQQAQIEEENRRCEQEIIKAAAEKHRCEVVNMMMQVTPCVRNRVLTPSSAINAPGHRGFNPVNPMLFYTSCTPLSSFTDTLALSQDNFFSPPGIDHLLTPIVSITQEASLSSVTEALPKEAPK